MVTAGDCQLENMRFAVPQVAFSFVAQLAAGFQVRLGIPLQAVLPLVPQRLLGAFKSVPEPHVDWYLN